MDRNKLLNEIFDSDDLGLLNIKPSSSPSRNEDERLVASFFEINLFYERNNREPEYDEDDVFELQLYSRLKSIRENPIKSEMLKIHDIYGLLNSDQKTITSLDDILNDDTLGLLSDDDTGLFDLKNVKQYKDRESADFVARRRPCKDFSQFEEMFKSVQLDLKNGCRKLINFKQDNLKEKCFYVHNGILLYLDSVKFEKQYQKFKSGGLNRPDGRTRTIFENGTESNMMFQSLYKALHDNGKVVTHNKEITDKDFFNKFSNIDEKDKAAGFIYILKSKSDKKEIKEITNLYKIGFSSNSVEERVKNASQEPTYLMADVRIIMSYQCYNMNPQVLENLLHGFFGKSCLNIDVYDKNGNRHSPREWFIAPLSVIEEAIKYIIAGSIVNYRYDEIKEQIITK